MHAHRLLLAAFATLALVGCSAGTDSDAGTHDLGAHADMAPGDTGTPTDMTGDTTLPADLGVDLPTPVDLGVDLPGPGDTGVDMPAPVDGGVDMPAPVDGGADMPAPVDLGADACSGTSTDPSFIHTSCSGAMGCPSGYACEAFEGIVVQYFCEIPCTTACDCPTGRGCYPTTDKAGTHYYCGLAP